MEDCDGILCIHQVFPQPAKPSFSEVRHDGHPRSIFRLSPEPWQARDWARVSGLPLEDVWLQAAGWRNHRAFEEASIRAAYHDLLEPEPGFTPDAQIEVMSVASRHYHHQSQARIERFSPINILSLAPMDSLSQLPSWKVNVGTQTIRHNGCDLCSNGLANVGLGASAETALFKREVYFAFAEAEANYSSAYEERHRIGGGGTVGMLADMTDRWNLMLSGSYLRYALGDQSDDIRWFTGSRYTLSQNWSLRLEYNHRDRDNDVVFSVQAFF